MSNVNGLKKSLERERNKQVRQEDALEATKSLIEVLEGQIAALEKAKK